MEPGVVVGELLVAVEGSGEPGAQRRVGCPLAGRNSGGGAGAIRLPPEPADLVADVGLGIEPGPGDPRFSELGRCACLFVAAGVSDGVGDEVEVGLVESGDGVTQDDRRGGGEASG